MSWVLIAFGANLSGSWGSPGRTIELAQQALVKNGVSIQCFSKKYATRPWDGSRQPEYLNAVASATTTLPPHALLLLLKRVEKAAGRKPGRLNGPRPLDLDLIDYAGRVTGWPVRRRSKGQLILPHPLAHRRAFVLRPLLDVAPRWRHPVLKATARQLLRALPEDA